MDSILGHKVHMNTKSHSHIHCTFLLLYLFFFPSKSFRSFSSLSFLWVRPPDLFSLLLSSFLALWDFLLHRCPVCSQILLTLECNTQQHSQVPLLRTFPHHWEGEALHSKSLKCLSNLNNPKGSSLLPWLLKAVSIVTFHVHLFLPRVDCQFMKVCPVSCLVFKHF